MEIWKYPNPLLFNIFFSCTSVEYKRYTFTTFSIRNIHHHNLVQILMPTFKTMVFEADSLVGRFRVLKPANEENNNTVDISHFTVKLV